MNIQNTGKLLKLGILKTALILTAASATLPAHGTNLANVPLFMKTSQPPLVMLTMARDHKLYYEAYNDYSDLNNDGIVDVGYKPSIDYYGYFDSNKCYTYSNGVFSPQAMSDIQNGKYNKKCTGTGRSNLWSGDFLNYVTTSRIDALRKVLYGGYRSTDTTTQTILERSFIPQDAHSWGKEYLSIDHDGYDIQEYTPLSLPSTGKRHLFANTTLVGYGSPPLMRVLNDSGFRVWEWLSIERPVAGTQCATGNNVRSNCASGSSVITDYNVRVEVCKTISGVSANDNYGREKECKAYSDGTTTTYKPTGVLQSYGSTNEMFFGLLTGSYDQNTNGGILRKAVSSITNEIETTTGIFKESGSTCGLAGASTCVRGVIGSINRLHITSYDYGSYAYSCGWINTRQIVDGECEMWGNPLAEMMYETIRYFSGASAATSSFTTSSTRDSALVLPGGNTGLPRVTTWTNLYTSTPASPLGNAGPFPSCSKASMLLISDVSPSFDSDSVPGADSNFGSVGATTINGSSLDVSAIAQNLWNSEYGASQNVFIGQVGTNYDGAPTPKAVSTFGNIRGLAPGDPTRQGSYYAASIANFGLTHDVNAVTGTQNVSTYAIALSTPLPKIQVTVDRTTGQQITLVPFAKTVGGMGVSATSGAFQPTNQIVDFYVDTIKNVAADNEDTTVNGGRPYYKFRINFEDVEQGADHDMDAIALYEIFLNADKTVTVKIQSDYAAGGMIQHMGYVISGTTKDGVYLVVRDSDTGYSSDPEYFLDRPNSSDSGTDASYHLPLLPSSDPNVPDASNYATRTFTANSTSGSAITLRDPLWYAAKYGGKGKDTNNDGVIDSIVWDEDNDGVPDNYFLVTNASKLETQLKQALDNIINAAGTASVAAGNSFTLSSDTRTYVGGYGFNSNSGWWGSLIAYPITVTTSGTSLGTPVWKAENMLGSKSPNDRVILTYDPDQATSKGIPFRWASMTATTGAVLQTSLSATSSGSADSLGSNRVSYLRGNSVTNMRVRPTLSDGTTLNILGDIVNSAPQYVARPNAGYGDASYAKFAGDYSATSNPTGVGNRTPMIYVGANDGMLHGFNANTGEELLAYIPGEMYRFRDSRWVLNKLTEPDYGLKDSTNVHRYYVDGSPNVTDICITANTSSCPDGNWRTLLVGSLGAGGQGIYALDVTNPSNFSEANASSIVKWEFSDKNDQDMGYLIGKPYIVNLCTSRLNDGSCDAWSPYVLINNGFNNTEADGYTSTSGDAVLYVLNATTGALVKKIPVIEGDTTASGPNGLSELAPIDIDGDGVVDYVYAGDLKGNLWRFDFTSDRTSSWGISLGSSSNPSPVYVAWDEQSTRQRQPITTAPDAILHPNGGVLLLFGTGKYVFSYDPQDSQIQTVYGIWDKLDGTAVTSTSRSNLQQQQVITSTYSDGITVYRTITGNSVDWTSKRGWYFNLPDTKERIAFDPQVIGSSVFRITSIVPSQDICSDGGYSWEYFVDALTGGHLTWSVYSDIAGTHAFGDTTGFASARKSTTGVTPQSGIFGKGGGKGVELPCGSGGCVDGGGGGGGVGIDTGGNGSGRIGWREILTD